MRRVSVGSRDRALMRYLNDYGFLSTRQVLDEIFPGVSYFTAMRRLRRLESGGLIERHSGLERGQALWMPTARGGLKTGVDVIPIGINHNQLSHDMTVTRVRMKLEKERVASNWTATKLIAARANKRRLERGAGTEELSDPVSDGLFVLKTVEGPRVVALEVELVRKGKRRYEWLFDRYRGHKEIHFILYVVPNASLGEFIASLAVELKQRYTYSYGNAKYLWGLLDDMMSDPWEAQLHIAGGGEVKLSQLCVKPKTDLQIASPKSQKPQAGLGTEARTISQAAGPPGETTCSGSDAQTGGQPLSKEAGNG